MTESGSDGVPGRFCGISFKLYGLNGVQIYKINVNTSRNQ